MIAWIHRTSYGKYGFRNLTINTTETSAEQNKNSGNKKDEDEIIPVEEEGIDDNIDDEETETIFQNYLKNLKESGFRRTNPAGQAERMKTFKCITCNFVAKNDYQFKEHLKFKHSAENKERLNIRGQRTQFCHYWNNYGNCTFESRNGRPCKFAHKNAPMCKFDGNCDRKFCMFQHKSQNMSFLLNAQPDYRHQGGQRGYTQNHSNQFSQQNQQGGTKRWGNTRRF